MLQKALLVSGAFVGILSNQGLAAERKLENQGCYVVTAHVIQQGDRFTSGSFENTNVRLPDQIDSAVFPQLSGHCTGAFTVIKGEADEHGSCEFADAANNKFVVVFTFKGDPKKDEGTWQFIGGTGKYDGITGDGKFKTISETPIPGMANATGGCDHVWGTYSAPGIK
jgi:hypothetical protein